MYEGGKQVAHQRCDCRPPPRGGWRVFRRVNNRHEGSCCVCCVVLQPVERTPLRHFSVNLLTGDAGSGSWTYLVWTVGENVEESIKVNTTIESPKPRGQELEIMSEWTLSPLPPQKSII